MKSINVVNGPANASAIIMGCMRMPALSVDQAEKRFGDAFKQSGLKREEMKITPTLNLADDVEKPLHIVSVE